MKIYYLVCALGIFIGLLASYSVKYVSKFNDFMTCKKKINKTMMIKTIDIVGRLFFVVLYLAIYYVPIELFTLFINDTNILKKINSIFIYSLTFSFFISLIILVKLKKLQKLQ